MKKKLTTGFAVLALTFLSLEILVRAVPFNKSAHVEWFHMDRVAEHKQQPWYSDLESDYTLMNRDFQIYELYKLKPFHGKVVSTTPAGYRTTIQARKDSQYTNAPMAALFGGSTVWGSGSRDEHTIASRLSLQLERLTPAKPIHVLNFGETGFVLSQDFIRALRLLQTDSTVANAPKRSFVFFGGVNDALSAITNYAQGNDHPAGLPWEHEKFQYLFRLGHTGEVRGIDIARKSKFLRWGFSILESRGWMQPDEKNDWRDPSDEALQHLSEEVAERYIRLVRDAHLSFKGHNISTVFVLQPLMEYKRTLSEDERAVSILNQRWQGYLRKTFDRIAQKSTRLPSKIAFHDFKGLFANESSTLFSDVIHYSETGNDRIALEIARLLLPNSKASLLAKK